jgi:phosphatidylglycerol:prolipoprotein diacylglycerol transferase
VIPYFELRELPIGGGRSIAVFGLLVVLGVTVGTGFLLRLARARGVLESDVRAAVLSALIPGFLLSHWLTLALEGPRGERSLWVWLEFWNGMSSFGGFIGAALGLGFYVTLVRRRPWLPLADLFVQALVVGWVFGRLGCTLVHDHVGRLSDFPLAIAFPGGARHDLGLYEFLYTVAVLVPAVVWLGRRERPQGTALAVLALLYAPARFLGDFLRNTDLPGQDPRFFGLTVAQYACIALLGLALALAMRLRRARPS